MSNEIVKTALRKLIVAQESDPSQIVAAMDKLEEIVYAEGKASNVYSFTGDECKNIIAGYKAVGDRSKAIECIKIIRFLGGLGLKEAKDLFDTNWPKPA